MIGQTYTKNGKRYIITAVDTRGAWWREFGLTPGVWVGPSVLTELTGATGGRRLPAANKAALEALSAEEANARAMGRRLAGIGAARMVDHGRRLWGAMRESARAQARLQVPPTTAAPMQQCVSWADLCKRTDLFSPLDPRSDPLAEGYAFKWFQTRRPLIRGGHEDVEVRDASGNPMGDGPSYHGYGHGGDE